MGLNAELAERLGVSDVDVQFIHRYIENARETLSIIERVGQACGVPRAQLNRLAAARAALPTIEHQILK